MKETSHLLKSKKNAERLMVSIKNIETGNFESKKLINDNISFGKHVWEDYLYWQGIDKKIKK